MLGSTWKRTFPWPGLPMTAIETPTHHSPNSVVDSAIKRGLLSQLGETASIKYGTADGSDYSATSTKAMIPLRNGALILATRRGH